MKHLLSPWFKYIEQNSPLDNLTFWLCDFWHLFCIWKLWYNLFPVACQFFWVILATLHFQVLMKDVLFESIIFLLIYFSEDGNVFLLENINHQNLSQYEKVREETRKYLRTHPIIKILQSCILRIPFRETLRVKLHLAHNPFLLSWRLWKHRSLPKRAKIIFPR